MVTEKTPDNNLQDLKAAREALGLSLEDVFKQTRISVSYLQAIENKEFHLLPVPVYSKNFIKIYAGVLGLDSGPIIRSYENFVNSQKEEQTPPPEEVPAKKNLFPMITGQKAYGVIALVLVVVIIVSWLISKQHEASSDIINSTGAMTSAVQENRVQNAIPSANVVAPVTEQTKAQPAPAPNETSKQLPAAKQAVSVSSDNVDVNTIKKQIALPVGNIQTASNSGETSLLVIKAIEETWMRIKVDQNPSFQVVLKPGEKFERKAASFEIDVGNAGGVKMQFKGKDMENLGKTGEVVHLRLPLP